MTPGDEAVVHFKKKKKKNLVNEEDWERTMAIVDFFLKNEIRAFYFVPFETHQF